MPKILDLTNKRFGRLIALSVIPGNIKVRRAWVCQCDCGNITQVSTGELTGGSISSCGCLRLDNLRKALSHYESRAAAGLGKHFTRYRSNAKHTNTVFELTIEQFIDIVKQPCYYCGTSDNRVNVAHRLNKIYQLRVNGIDRFNNDLGYISSNCVPCCGPCNRAKLQMTAQNYIKLCRAVVRIHGNEDIT